MDDDNRKLTETLFCAMKLQKFPFDTQSCPIYLESFGYTMDTLYFNWLDSPVDVDKGWWVPYYSPHHQINNQLQKDTLASPNKERESSTRSSAAALKPTNVTISNKTTDLIWLYRNIPGYKMTDIILHDCSQNYTSGAYPCLEIRFILQRDRSYYYMNVSSVKISSQKYTFHIQIHKKWKIISFSLHSRFSCRAFWWWFSHGQFFGWI